MRKFNLETRLQSLPGTRAQQLATIDRQVLPENLYEYAKASWHILDPAPFCDNWHIGAICEHLQAVTENQIKNLLINIPPRCSKSSVVTVLWPTWGWIHNPGWAWLFTSYRMRLSQRDSGRRRSIISSPWYQARWGDSVSLDPKQQERVDFWNTARGRMLCASIDSGVTGDGGDFLVTDDPHDPKGAESEVQRESTIEYFKTTWPSRKNDMKTAHEVTIMQRLHEKDVSGLILERNNAVHLKLPMEYTGDKCVTSIGWQDPRDKIGETLDPNRFPPEELTTLKRDLGPYGVAGQLQQEPAPQEGGIIKRSWINTYHWQKDKILIDPLGAFDPMDKCLRFSTVDMAFTEEHIGGKKKGMKDDPDYSVVATWAVFRDSNNLPYVVMIDMDRRRVSGPDIIPMLKSAKGRWMPSFMALESIGAQSAISEMAKREGIPVRIISTSKSDDVIYTIDKDKTARAMAATPLMADGRFWIPEAAPFSPIAIKELTTFPNAAHDDIVDVSAYAVSIAEKLTGRSLLDTLAHREMAQSEPVRREGLKDPDRDRPSREWDRMQGASPY